MIVLYRMTEDKHFNIAGNWPSGFSKFPVPILISKLKCHVW